MAGRGDPRYGADHGPSHLAIAGKTLLNVDIDAEVQEIGAAITTLLQFSTRFNLPFAAFLMKLPLPSNVRMRRAQQHLDTTMYRLIHERRANRESWTMYCHAYWLPRIPSLRPLG